MAYMMLRQKGEQERIYQILCDTITNSIETLGGMVCDGAKANCAAKAGMALHGAMQALALAEAGLGADEECGIVARTAAETAGNVYRLAREGAGGTDRVLCRIEVEKQGGWR